MTNDESKLRALERTAGGRLLVRRPTRDDLDDVFRIHGDPRTNVHNPTGPGRDLNLYHRFVPEAWGRGYASEVARYAVQWAASTHPGLPVLARTRPGNIASRHVAEAVGLVLQPDLQAYDGHGPMVVFGQPMAGPT